MADPENAEVASTPVPAATPKKRGRPRKHHSVEAPKRPRGRPRKPLRERPGRWDFAMYAAYLELSVVSKSEASDAVARVLTGGTDFRVPPISSKPLSFRYREPERAFADDLRRTVRRFRKDPDDSAWFLPAIALCRLVLDGRIDRLDEARAIAASIGEEAHFEAELLPLMREAFARQAHSALMSVLT